QGQGTRHHRAVGGRAADAAAGGARTTGRAMRPSAGGAPQGPARAYRARLLYFRAGEPAETGCEWLSDGLLVVRDGHILHAGAYRDLQPALPPGTELVDWRDRIIAPGFIDTHAHYPQTDIIASPAPGLLPWLERYTFPAERRFEDAAYARTVAD